MNENGKFITVWVGLAIAFPPPTTKRHANKNFFDWISFPPKKFAGNIDKLVHDNRDFASVLLIRIATTISHCRKCMQTIPSFSVCCICVRKNYSFSFLVWVSWGGAKLIGKVYWTLTPTPKALKHKSSALTNKLLFNLFWLNSSQT